MHSWKTCARCKCIASARGGGTPSASRLCTSACPVQKLVYCCVLFFRSVRRDERRKGAALAGKEKQEKRERHIKQRKDKKLATKIARVSHLVVVYLGKRQ